MVKHLGDVRDVAKRLDSRAGRRGRDASGNVPEHVLARCFVRFERRLSVASGWAMMRDVPKVSVSTTRRHSDPTGTFTERRWFFRELLRLMRIESRRAKGLADWFETLG